MLTVGSVCSGIDLNADRVLDLADKAARCVLRGNPVWTSEDWEDARQGAAIGIIEAMGREKDTGEGYLLNAAKHQIYEWMRSWLRHKRSGTLFDYVDYIADDSGHIMIDRDRIAGLMPMLERARIKVRADTHSKVQTEIQFLILLMEGYSIDGIALELGMSVRNTYAVRERLLPYLKDIAEMRQRTARTYEIRESSRAALARINAEPEMIKRRGEKIRAALAEKKRRKMEAHHA